jgi:hypothetical protein
MQPCMRASFRWAASASPWNAAICPTTPMITTPTADRLPISGTGARQAEYIPFQEKPGMESMIASAAIGQLHGG